MSDIQGIKLMLGALVLSVACGLIALAVSPEMQRDLRDDLWRRWDALIAMGRDLRGWLHPPPRRDLRWQDAPVLEAVGRDAVGRRGPYRPLPDDDNDFELLPIHPPPPWGRGGAHPPPTHGVAADTPPVGLEPLILHHEWMDRRYEPDPLRFAIGWTVAVASPVGEIVLEVGTFRRGQPTSVVNILNTGQIGSGKDVLLRAMLLPLLLRNSPQAVSLAIIDGKGLDYVRYAGLPHLVALANDIPDIPPALAWLDAERDRRKTLLRAADAKSWADAAQKPFPLLIVYISELTTLERFVDRFWDWANDHLSQDRALGICYIVGTQTASNTPTRWRRQVQLFVAGYQPSTDDDRPNTNIGAGSWPEKVVPPSGLPLGGGGYFTAVLGRKAVNVRAGFISDAEERQALDAIRARWGAAPVREAVPVRQGAATPADRPESAPEAPVLAPTANQYVPGTADTDAVQASSAPVTADAVVRGELSRDELLSRTDTVRLLAIQRKPDDSDWAYSANKIADLVGGTRAGVLGQIRAIRGGASEEGAAC